MANAAASQAGRRGFEPRLPLYLFKNLPTNLKSHPVRRYDESGTCALSARASALGQKEAA